MPTPPDWVSLRLVITFVDRYRHGHEMVHGNGAAGKKRKENQRDGSERTENLRKAMVDFRAVFEQLAEDVETPDEVEQPATA